MVSTAWIYTIQFDSVWRKGLWRTTRHYGYPEKIIWIQEGIYKETFSAVRVGGDLTEWFKTVVGVLWGCVLSPLFNIFQEIIIITAIDDDASGAGLNGVRISDLHFADDIALLAETKQQLQQMLDKRSLR